MPKNRVGVIRMAENWLECHKRINEFIFFFDSRTYLVGIPNPQSMNGHNRLKISYERSEWYRNDKSLLKRILWILLPLFNI